MYRNIPPLCDRKIEAFLNKRNIKFTKDKTFPDCINKKPLKFDYYLDDYGIVIESFGEHHYRPIIFHEKMTSESALVAHNRTKLHDSIRKQYCKNKRIKRLVFNRENIKTLETRLNKELTAGVLICHTLKKKIVNHIKNCLKLFQRPSKKRLIKK